MSNECDTHESIDDALRAWVDLTTKLRDQDPDSQDDVLSCAQLLLESQLFQTNKDYVRTQIVHSLLQEDDTGPLHAIACLLFLDGRHDDSTFPRMIEDACFPRLLELINGRQDDEDPRLHRLLLQLMYEMSRVERLKLDDLMLVDDGFIHYLFRIVEGVSDDVQDPYHYPTIRVLVSIEAGLLRKGRAFVVLTATACPERTVHVGIDRLRHRFRCLAGPTNEPYRQMPQPPRTAVSHIRGEYHLALEPRDRDIPAASNTEAALSAIHHESNLRVLLHKRPAGTFGCHHPESDGPAR